MVDVTRVWPFKQRGQFIEGLEWKTDLMQFKSGEQRIALRAAPRRYFSYEFLMTDSEVASASALIREADIFQVPDWGQRASVSSASGTTVIADVSNLNLANGDTAILWETALLYEVVVISTIVGSTITVDAVDNVYTNAIIMPLVSSRLRDGISISRAGAEINMVSADFEVFDATDIAATTYSTYRSFDLMDDDRMLAGSELTEGASWDLQVIDNEFGAIQHIKRRDYYDREFTMRWRLTAQADILALRKWIHARRGKQKVFWTSSKAKDLEPASAASGTSLTVFEHEGATLLGRTGTFDIQIEDASGTRYNRRVNSYVAGTAVGGRATVNLTLDQATTIAQANIARISYLRLVRFNSDRVEIQHIPASGILVAVPLIEVPA